MNSSPDASWKEGSEAKRRRGSLTPPWKCPGSAKYWNKKLMRRGTRRYFLNFEMNSSTSGMPPCKIK